MRTAVTVLNGKMYDVELNRTGGAVVVLNGVVQAEGVPYLNGVGGGAVVVLNGQTLPVINRVGGAVVVLNGVDHGVVNRSGGAVVVLNGQELPLVNSVSQSTLNNLSTSATLNAIANARVIDAQPNKFIDVAANAFVQFNANSTESTLFNSLASVNARAVVDANRIANGETVLINTRTTAVTVLNGSSAYVNANTLSSTTQKTPVIVDQADLNSATGNIATIAMNGINMITGINSGEQYIIPATLFSPNFDVTYKAGTVTIAQAPLSLKANNLTKAFGETISISPTGFNITDGTTRYTERISLAAMASQGATGTASPGSYPITISNAMGSYGTDMNNYKVTYTNGTLNVVSVNCPVLTHSRMNNFVSTTSAPVSLWLNVQIKVRGQLAKANDSIVLRGGRLVLENVTFENSANAIIVPDGVVIARAGITAPVSRYDNERGVFITLVPVGFSSTADIFITGAIVNSKTGFIRGRDAGSVLSGIFQSNVSYNGQWNYAMAAYQPEAGNRYVQYRQLTTAGDVIAMSGSFKAGTPMPWLSRITSGGTGNGGSNYTGSSSSNDNFSSCVITALPGATNRNFITSAEPGLIDEKKIVASDKELLVFPNPANAFVTVSFVAPASGQAVLRIYSAAGTQVHELYQGIAQANKIYTRRIDTQQWPKGVYVVQLVVQNQAITRKLVISP
jgi:hypothetical protein